ncbi:MAG: hypothetical protein ABSH29_24295 [Acidimicrobiales bacterium]
MALEHGALEDRLERESREVFRRLFHDHLIVRVEREERIEVVGAAGNAHRSVEAGHRRTLARRSSARRRSSDSPTANAARRTSTPPTPR